MNNFGFQYWRETLLFFFIKIQTSLDIFKSREIFGIIYHTWHSSIHKAVIFNRNIKKNPVFAEGFYDLKILLGLHSRSFLQWFISQINHIIVFRSNSSLTIIIFSKAGSRATKSSTFWWTFSDLPGLLEYCQSRVSIPENSQSAYIAKTISLFAKLRTMIYKMLIDEFVVPTSW